MKSILDIIFGTVFMNKIRLQVGETKRSKIVTIVSSLYTLYTQSFDTYSHNFIVQVLLILAPISLLVFILSLPSVGVPSSIFTVVVNFIVFRLITNK